MFWWGVSVLAQNPAVDALLDQLRPSLAYLGDARRPTGAAALVDSDQGLFLAHVDAVQGDTVQAKVGEWRVSLRVLGEDSRTGLVILSLRSDAPASMGPAIPVADADPTPGSKVCVVLADGGVLGTFVGGPRIFIDGRKPAIPASELRFENPPQFVGGALVMTFDGKLLGAMGATVARNSSAISLRALKEVKKGLTGRLNAPQAFLPAPLTVAYTPSLNLVRRSVAGLISPENNHRPVYPVLGVLVDGDVPGGGAVIRQIVPDGPMGRAGVRVNDVLLAVGDRAIRTRYDFMESMLLFKPGERIPLRIRHDGVERTVEVLLARAKG